MPWDISYLVEFTIYSCTTILYLLTRPGGELYCTFGTVYRAYQLAVSTRVVLDIFEDEQI